MLPLLAVGSGTGVVEADVSSRVLVPEGCDLEVADEDVLLNRWRVWSWSPSILLLEGGKKPWPLPLSVSVSPPPCQECGV